MADTFPAFLVELPCAIEAEWDDQWGPKLAGFPVELAYLGIGRDARENPAVIRARYSFDPGSFFEDDVKKQLHYLPRLPSDYHVQVRWNKTARRWETSKFQGTRLIAQAVGSTFEKAMLHTLLIGLQSDEPAD